MNVRHVMFDELAEENPEHVQFGRFIFNSQGFLFSNDVADFSGVGAFPHDGFFISIHVVDYSVVKAFPVSSPAFVSVVVSVAI